MTSIGSTLRVYTIGNGVSLSHLQLLRPSSIEAWDPGLSDCQWAVDRVAWLVVVR